MIKITPTKTQLDLDLEAIDAPLSLLENQVRGAIHNLNASFERFWALPDDRIEAVLNYHGPAAMEQIFTAHYTYGSVMNQMLADRGIGEPRAVLGKPREISMDETGRLFLVPLPVEEPAPDPVEEP